MCEHRQDYFKEQAHDYGCWQGSNLQDKEQASDPEKREAGTTAHAGWLSAAQSLLVSGLSLLFYSSFLLIIRGPPMLEWAACFTQSIYHCCKPWSSLNTLIESFGLALG